VTEPLGVDKAIALDSDSASGWESTRSGWVFWVKVMLASARRCAVATNLFEHPERPARGRNVKKSGPTRKPKPQSSKNDQGGALARCQKGAVMLALRDVGECAAGQ